MREDSLMIQNVLPNADQVEKLDKKNPVSYIYAGKPSRGYEKFGTEARIQLNDKISDVRDIPSFIFKERDNVPEDQVPYMTTSIKADKESSVGTLTDIRLKLRDVNALKISYSAAKSSDY